MPLVAIRLRDHRHVPHAFGDIRDHGEPLATEIAKLVFDGGRHIALDLAVLRDFHLSKRTHAGGIAQVPRMGGESGPRQAVRRHGAEHGLRKTKSTRRDGYRYCRCAGRADGRGSRSPRAQWSRPRICRISSSGCRRSSSPAAGGGNNWLVAMVQISCGDGLSGLAAAHCPRK